MSISAFRFPHHCFIMLVWAARYATRRIISTLVASIWVIVGASQQPHTFLSTAWRHSASTVAQLRLTTSSNVTAALVAQEENKEQLLLQEQQEQEAFWSGRAVPLLRHSEHCCRPAAFHIILLHGLRHTIVQFICIFLLFDRALPQAAHVRRQPVHVRFQLHQLDWNSSV